MILLNNIEQGSPEWFQARLGIPTASRFKDILTSQGKPASGQATYMHELLAEWLIGEPQDTYESEWMRRGTELEPEAREFYEYTQNTQVHKTGIAYLDDRKLVACSPDGLINDGGLELKCPKPSTQIKYLLANRCPSEYIPQVQGNIWICEAEWWDFMSYHPDIAPVIIRVNRDDEFISLLEKEVSKFLEKMLEKRHKLIEHKVVA